MNGRRHQRAFTVVELLIAVAITVVIAGIMVSVTTGTLSVWRKAQDRFTADTTAQLIFDFLERDLQGAIFRRDGNIWMRCETFDADLASHGWISATPMKPTSTDFVPTGANPSIADARFSASGHWLRFFTTTPGTPIAVGYQVVRRSFASTDFPDAESVRYSLFRAITTDSATFNTGYDLTKFDDLLKPSTTYNAGTNVIDFGVWFYRESDTGDLERIFPISSETSFSVKDQDAPAYVDVMVRILTEEGAAKISAIERGLVFMPAEFGNDYGAWWWSVANAHSRVFVRRIALRSVAF